MREETRERLRRENLETISAYWRARKNDLEMGWDNWIDIDCDDCLEDDLDYYDEDEKEGKIAYNIEENWEEYVCDEFRQKIQDIENAGREPIYKSSHYHQILRKAEGKPALERSKIELELSNAELLRIRGNRFLSVEDMDGYYAPWMGQWVDYFGGEEEGFTDREERLGIDIGEELEWVRAERMIVNPGKQIRGAWVKERVILSPENILKEENDRCDRVILDGAQVDKGYRSCIQEIEEKAREGYVSTVFRIKNPSSSINRVEVDLQTEEVVKEYEEGEGIREGYEGVSFGESVYVRACVQRDNTKTLDDSARKDYPANGGCSRGVISGYHVDSAQSRGFIPHVEGEVISPEENERKPSGDGTLVYEKGTEAKETFDRAMADRDRFYSEFTQKAREEKVRLEQQREHERALLDEEQAREKVKGLIRKLLKT